MKYFTITDGVAMSDDAGLAGYRYQRLAGEMEQKIRDGQFRAGDRLPSVRELQARTGLSITTITQSYLELETRGLVEPREKSGYFVRPLIRDLLPVPEQGAQTATRPRRVAINSLAESITSVIHDPQMLPFGAAVPSPKLLPVKALARITKSVCGRYFGGSGLNYGPTDGVPELKHQLAVRAFGYDCGADEVIVTNGCIDGIQHCLRAVAQPGDIIITESPTFNCYLQLIEELGLLALEIPSSADSGMDLRALENILVNGTWRRSKIAACLVNPSFQNPLGFVMPEERKAELVELLFEYEIPIIEDDIYSELFFGVNRPLPIKAFDTQGMVLYCSSFSKTLAPDLRVGWVAPGRFYDKVLRLKFNSTIAQSKLPQLILADFLASGLYDRHLRKLRLSLKQHMSNMIQAVARYFPQGTRMTAPDGGYILWVELSEQIDSLELFQRAKDDEKIFIIPGAITSSSGRFSHCIRLSCGYPWNPEFEDGMQRLGRLVEQLSR